MEVKEKYETPMMEMIGFNREEVVTMSGQGDEIPNENFVDSNVQAGLIIESDYETLRDPRQALSAGAPPGFFSAFYCLLSGKSV